MLSLFIHLPSTSILSFWQLFLNPASPNNYMSESKRNPGIMRNSCSSLSTSFPLHKRTWVFVWWRYKSCCWVVKQQPIKTLSYYAFKIDYTCIENNAMYLENRRNVQLPYLTKYTDHLPTDKCNTNQELSWIHPSVLEESFLRTQR